MSFGFSISDIAQSLRIAKEIKEIWFSAHNRADAHYLQFGRDVAGFGNLLTKFKEAYGEYARVREIQLGVRHYHEWSGKTIKEKQEQEDQVGGFEVTINKCRELLVENQKYLIKRANAWDQAKWHLLSGQERADKLRSRLQFHSTKIGVFMQTMSVCVQASTALALRDIQVQIRQLPTRVLDEILRGISGQPRKNGLHPVLPALDEQYLLALETDKPEAYVDVAHFPLKEGLDALANALESSTTRFAGSGLGLWRPDVQQLNNLIKARWIFDRMVQSKELAEAGPESLWRWCLESVKESIEIEYAKFEAEIIAEEANIAQLETESFRIWMPPQESESQSVANADVSQQEEKILEVSLANSGPYRKDLIVFRRPRNEVRVLMITSRQNSEMSAPHEDNKVVNMHKVQVVPRYALPSRRGTSPDDRMMELCFPGASTGYTYQFRVDEDLFKFQQALLGYKVVYDNPTCHWTFLQRGAWGTSDKTKGVGRVQIWQAKPLSPPDQSCSPYVPGSPLSRQSRTDSIHSSSATTIASTIRALPRIGEFPADAGNVVALQRPALPVVVIFTEVNKKPTLLVLKLEHNIRMNPKSCDCGAPREKYQQACQRTVLEKNPPDRDKFTLTQLSEDPSAGPSSWNIAVFAHPRHPDVDSQKKFKDVRWISIDCPSPSERDEFQYALKTVAKIRDGEQREYDTQRGLIQRMAERPTHSRTNTLALPSRAPTRTGSTSSPSIRSGSDMRSPSMRSPSLASGSVDGGDKLSVSPDKY